MTVLGGDLPAGVVPPVEEPPIEPVPGAVYVIYNVTSNVTSEPTMSISSFNTAYQANIYTGLVFPVGSLLKDLGRFIHVYDPSNSNNLWRVYRQMMLVSGITQEGISSQIGYVCTWAADGISQAILGRVG
jgi:hypothetical protein